MPLSNIVIKDEAAQLIESTAERVGIPPGRFVSRGMGLLLRLFERGLITSDAGLNEAWLTVQDPKNRDLVTLHWHWEKEDHPSVH